MKLLSAVAALFLISPALATSVPLSQDNGGRLTMPVTIDGQGPLAFVVDSAAQRSTIAQATVDRLQLAIQGGARIVGASGMMRANLVTVKNYASALFTRDSDALGVLPNNGVSTADGVVGMDLFAQQRIDFDFTAQTLSVNPSGSPSGAMMHIPVTLTAGTFVIVDVTIDGVHAKAMLDTGARRTTGNLLLKQALGLKDGDPRLTPDEPIRGATMDQTPATKAVVGSIALGPAHFDKPQVTFADLPVFHPLGIGDGPAILIGIDQLKRLRQLAIDYPKAELQIKIR